MKPNAIETDALLMVLEPGAPWPPSAEDHRGGNSDGVVLIQQPEEAAGELLRRAQKSVAKLSAHGRRVRTALLCVNTEVGERLLNARALLAQALVRFVQRDGGRLVLIAPETGFAAYEDLNALASALTEMLAGTGVSVQVEWTGQGQKSAAGPGVHRAKPRREREPSRRETPSQRPALRFVNP